MVIRLGFQQLRTWIQKLIIGEVLVVKISLLKEKP